MVQFQIWIGYNDKKKCFQLKENLSQKKLKRKYTATDWILKEIEFLGKGVLKICSKFTGEHLQLYWNHTSTWMFFCKFAAYFQNIFS